MGAFCSLLLRNNMKNIEKLQEELRKEFENKRNSDAKIENLMRQISEQEKQNEKLSKNIEEAFKFALKSSKEEMKVLTDEINKKQSEMDDFSRKVSQKAAIIAEKFGVPVYYSISDTDYSYGPKSYQDKWAKYEEELERELCFQPANEGWSSSSC